MIFSVIAVILITSICHCNVIFLVLYDNFAVDSNVFHDQSSGYVITNILWILGEFSEAVVLG
jgi:hypothetical protein